MSSNQKQDVNSWWAADGNNTHAVTYPLNEDALVVDLGGYHGLWAKQIIIKYNPHMVLVEPVPQYYDHLTKTFADNPKVTVLNYGISTNTHEGELFLNSDATSKYLRTGSPIRVKFITMTDLFNMIDKPHVDLIQINIEGEEYPLLEQMLEDGTILKFSNIQIQYHDFIANAIERRNNIQGKMLEHFNKKFDFPFIFEGWSLK